jgi:hypothetical protein
MSARANETETNNADSYWTCHGESPFSSCCTSSPGTTIANNSRAARKFPHDRRDMIEQQKNRRSTDTPSAVAHEIAIRLAV